uniref:Uncharacterized protein n=1 Tax=Arundo donax TaxID=35708 RepID=A0A0A8ZMT3_ARUDO
MPFGSLEGRLFGKHSQTFFASCLV